MRLQFHHRAEYRYSEPVTSSVNELRLEPPSTAWQTCESSSIRVSPEAELRRYEDLNVNRVLYFEETIPHQELIIDSQGIVVTRCKVDFDDLPYGFLHNNLDLCANLEECHPFLQDSEFIRVTPTVWRLGLDIRGRSKDVFETSCAIREYLHANFKYKPSVAANATEVLKRRSGLSRDFAHAMVALCRSLSIPVRYVSGYLFDASGDKPLRGSESSHAWVEVYIEPFGWIGLDPTNNKIVDDAYIVLARGRDHCDAAPVSATLAGNAKIELSVQVKVERLD